MENNFALKIQAEVKRFSIDGIIDDLPEMLKQPCTHLVDEAEKEVFLIGALGVVSGLLPNLIGLYSGKWITPNLYVYVLAGYGGGKGGLDYARKLGEQIHHEKRETAKRLMADYQKDLEIYKKNLKYFSKTNSEGEPPTPPTKPPTSMLFIPANNSKSGIYQLLKENNGKGIIFESEGDTLADALKQDYGNFSDTLRKAFHHEYLDLFRRMNDELIEIQHPELSLVLSSTYNQLKILIPSVENGLYSRFLFYELKQNNRFENVFDDRKKNYQEYFEKVGWDFKQFYDRLQTLPSVTFWLTDEQKQQFVKLFDEKKEKLIEDVDATMAGTANRLGIIAFRIMMIFTALRIYEAGAPLENIRCSNIDFGNAIRIVERLEKHARTVYEYLNGQPEKKKLAQMLSKEGKSYGDISKIIFDNENHKSTVYRWITGKK